MTKTWCDANCAMDNRLSDCPPAKCTVGVAGKRTKSNESKYGVGRHPLKVPKTTRRQRLFSAVIPRGGCRYAFSDRVKPTFNKNMGPRRLTTLRPRPLVPLKRSTSAQSTPPRPRTPTPRPRPPPRVRPLTFTRRLWSQQSTSTPPFFVPTPGRERGRRVPRRRCSGVLVIVTGVPSGSALQKHIHILFGA